MIVAIQSSTVIVKTMSPVAETDWPIQSNRQFLLRQSPDRARARMAARPRPPFTNAVLSQKSYIRASENCVTLLAMAVPADRPQARPNSDR
jgi:hypothetical protein